MVHIRGSPFLSVSLHWSPDRVATLFHPGHSEKDMHELSATISRRILSPSWLFLQCLTRGTCVLQHVLSSLILSFLRNVLHVKNGQSFSNLNESEEPISYLLHVLKKSWDCLGYHETVSKECSMIAQYIQSHAPRARHQNDVQEVWCCPAYLYHCPVGSCNVVRKNIGHMRSFCRFAVGSLPH